MKDKEKLKKKKRLSLTNMNKDNKIFFGILGGATLGLLFFSWELVLSYLLPTIGSRELISFIGLIAGGVMGYYVGKNV